MTMTPQPIRSGLSGYVAAPKGTQSYTSGPWTLDVSTGRIYGAKDTVRIATVAPACVTVETIANARLIAAAPDLLAALRDAVSILGKVVADDLMPDIAVPRFPAYAFARAEAAIRRATDGVV